MKPEILIEDNGIKLARILNKFDTPIARYPKFGVWTYLLESNDGIIVFDPGQRFKMFSLKRVETGNAERTLEAVTSLFPQKPITQIIFSHYHADHAEAAPHLQALALEKFGLLPPIRFHEKEYEKKRLAKVINTSVEKMFRRSGYPDWRFGGFIQDNEQIGNTTFTAIHAPGHTTGNISLLSKHYKIIITGWWVEGNYKPLVGLVQKIADEDKKNYPKTLNRIRKFQKVGYKYYYYHPQIT